MLPCPQRLLRQCELSNHFLQLRRIEAVGQKCCDTSERQSHFGRHVVRQGALELGCITIISRCPLYPAESAARYDGERHRQTKDLFEHFVCKLIPHFRERRISFGDTFCLCFEQQQSLLNPSVYAFRISFGTADKKENTGLSAIPFETLKNNFPSLIHGMVVLMSLLILRANTRRPTTFSSRRNTMVPILDR